MKNERGGEENPSRGKSVNDHLAAATGGTVPATRTLCMGGTQKLRKKDVIRRKKT